MFPAMSKEVVLRKMRSNFFMSSLGTLVGIERQALQTFQPPK